MYVQQTKNVTGASLNAPHITHIDVEHVVIASTQSYEQVINALDTRLGLPANWDLLTRQLSAKNASWEQVAEETEALIGTSGFTTFNKLEQGVLLSLTGRQKKISQYSLGNHLLGVQMIEYMPEIGLYAPLRLTVYEDYEGNTFLAFDRLASLVRQYQHEYVTSMALLVDNKLEELALEAAGIGAKSIVSQ